MSVNASFTVVLGQLVDNGFELGLNDYPIWDEEYRNVLNDKIIKHFWFREIGFETPGMFKFYLNRTMNEIMPYYNKLYATTIYEYNPIHNADYVEEYDISRTNRNESENGTSVTGSGSDTSNGNTHSETTNHSESETNTNATDKIVEIDTPQGTVNLSGMTVNSEVVASKVKLNDNSATSSGSADDTQSNDTTVENTSSFSNASNSNSTGVMSGESTESYLRKLKGNYGVKTSQSMIQEERDLIINIDMKIISELDSLFMQLW